MAHSHVAAPSGGMNQERPGEEDEVFLEDERELSSYVGLHDSGKTRFFFLFRIEMSFFLQNKYLLLTSLSEKNRTKGSCNCKKNQTMTTKQQTD